MILSAIAAMAANRVIGRDGGLPWRLPEDFKFFKDKTMGHIMLMGRKTFESLGKPLPGRLHVVITRQADYRAPGAHVYTTLKDALEFCRTQTPKWGEEVFLIGGGEIYREALPVTDRIYLTEIKAEFPGDARFPEFSANDFKEIERRPGKEQIPYDFVTYERQKN
jgi:dihydrofolate reductase